MVRLTNTPSLLFSHTLNCFFLSNVRMVLVREKISVTCLLWDVSTWILYHPLFLCIIVITFTILLFISYINSNDNFYPLISPTFLFNFQRSQLNWKANRITQILRDSVKWNTRLPRKTLSERPFLIVNLSQDLLVPLPVVSIDLFPINSFLFFSVSGSLTSYKLVSSWVVYKSCTIKETSSL